MVLDMNLMEHEKVFCLSFTHKECELTLEEGKNSPKYINLFKALTCVGPVAYRLAIPLCLLEVHPMFLVSTLKKYHRMVIASSIGIQFFLLRISFVKRNQLSFL